MFFQNLKAMRSMTKDPNAAAKAREAERKANEEAGLKPISLAAVGIAGGPKKKAVFKSTLQPQNQAAVANPTNEQSTAPPAKRIKTMPTKPIGPQIDFSTMTAQEIEEYNEYPWNPQLELKLPREQKWPTWEEAELCFEQRKAEKRAEVEAMVENESYVRRDAGVERLRGKLRRGEALRWWEEVAVEQYRGSGCRMLEEDWEGGWEGMDREEMGLEGVELEQMDREAMKLEEVDREAMKLGES